MEKNLAISQIAKQKLPYESEILFQIIDQKELKTGVYTRNLYIATLFIMAKKQIQLKCQPTNEGLNKMYILRMENYSVPKGNEVVLDATAWMNLENVMLSERNRAQKATQCLVLFV